MRSGSLESFQQSSTGRTRDSMNLIGRIWHSSLGKKYLMAISGAALFGFVVAHLMGNLQIFLGPEAINRYGHFLQNTPELIWPARMGLIALVALHIASAATLTQENRAARPIAYARYQMVAASYASRTMIMSGIIIAVFIVYHLLHFTIQIPGINLTGQDFKLLQDAKTRHDIYRMMVIGYRQPLVSGFYILGLGLLCLHLSHGASSMFQSLGWKNNDYGKFLDGFGRLAALLIFLGYGSIPAAVLLGIVK
jgi:succinate dehydrogenase / fumarate reductase, cytochrome b subunit